MVILHLAAHYFIIFLSPWVLGRRDDSPRCLIIHLALLVMTVGVVPAMTYPDVMSKQTLGLALAILAAASHGITHLMKRDMHYIH